MLSDNGLWIPQETLDKIREVYPVGSRVRLLEMDDKYAPPVGTLGTVRSVDDAGTIHVDWDNGSGLGVAYNTDKCERIDKEKSYKKIKDYDVLYKAVDKLNKQILEKTEGSRGHRIGIEDLHAIFYIDTMNTQDQKEPMDHYSRPDAVKERIRVGKDEKNSLPDISEFFENTDGTKGPLVISESMGLLPIEWFDEDPNFDITYELCFTEPVQLTDLFCKKIWEAFNRLSPEQLDIQVRFSQQPDGTHVTQTDVKYFTTNTPFRTYTKNEWEHMVNSLSYHSGDGGSHESADKNQRDDYDER